MPEGYSAPRGKSIIERIEAELDATYAEYQRHPNAFVFERGICNGLTKALAIMLNPYDPNEKAVKAAVVQRYKNRHEEGTDEK